MDHRHLRLLLPQDQSLGVHGRLRHHHFLHHGRCQFESAASFRSAVRQKLSSWLCGYSNSMWTCLNGKSK